MTVETQKKKQQKTEYREMKPNPSNGRAKHEVLK
jgi:hypothetical protein